MKDLMKYLQEKNTYSKDLLDAWEGFIEMRQEIKKPLTKRALDLRIKKLESLSKIEEEKIAILDQSTAANWQDLYELKNPIQVNNPKWNELKDLGRDVFIIKHGKEEYNTLISSHKAVSGTLDSHLSTMSTFQIAWLYGDSVATDFNNRTT